MIVFYMSNCLHNIRTATCVFFLMLIFQFTSSHYFGQSYNKHRVSNHVPRAAQSDALDAFMDNVFIFANINIWEHICSATCYTYV